ncbi:hypothetical protein GP486_005994, partial [Trichoglossum hirsutum]
PDSMQTPPCPHCGRRASSPVQLGDSPSAAQAPSYQQMLESLESTKYMLLELLKRKNGKDYSAVKALFLNWKEYDFNGKEALVSKVRKETRRLQTVFREMYHFDAGESEDVFDIPSQFSADSLFEYIFHATLEFSKLQTPKGKLMIVYYNGHGSPADPDGDQVRGLLIGGYSVRQFDLLLIFANTCSRGVSNPIPWTPIQRRLETAPGFDVFLIMDCCYAGRATKSAQPKSMDVLAAVNRESEADLTPTGSLFTTALINALTASVSRPNGIRINELFDFLDHDTLLDEQTPHYRSLQIHQNPIVLRPLNIDTVHMDTSVGQNPPAVSQIGPHLEVDEAPAQDAQADRHSISSADNDIEADPWNIPNVQFMSEDGEGFSGRCVFDTGSDIDLISFSFVQRLGLQTHALAAESLSTYKTVNGDAFTPSHYVRVRLVTIRGTHIDKVIKLTVFNMNFNIDIILGGHTIITTNLLVVSMQSLQDASVAEESGQQYDTMAMSFGQTSTNREITVEDPKRTQVLVERLGELQQLLREELAKAPGAGDME